MVCRIASCSARQIRLDFPEIRKCYWGCSFRTKGYFGTTGGDVADDRIVRDNENHTTKPIVVGLVTNIVNGPISKNAWIAKEDKSGVRGV